MKFTSDIDIDVASKDAALKFIPHIPATIVRAKETVKHNSGVYFTEIPVDPFTGRASLDYQVAEERGYVKVDVLNVGLYTQVKSEEHLLRLMDTEPEWDKLYDPEFFAKLIHVGSHYNTLVQMPEAVNSIPRLAMFLAVIRPAKRHLIGKSWKDVAATVWDKPTDGYAFKRSHSVAYSQLVVVNMNLLIEGNNGM
jgi:hypothetical protein